MSGRPASSAPGRISRRIVRWRGRVVAGWVVVALIVVPHGRGIEERLAGASGVEGTPAAAAAALLDSAFTSPRREPLVLVLPGLDPSRPASRELLASLTGRVGRVGGVGRVLSPLSTSDTLLVGAGGRGVLLVVGLEPGVGADSVVDALRAATRAALEETPSAGVTDAAWTGELPIWADLRRFSADDARRSELRALPLTLLLLLLVFGSVVAALLPLAAGVVAIAVTLGAAGLIASHLTLSISLHNIVTILGLALGIDYSLLLVRRFREGMREGLGAENAAAGAIHWSGGTLALSGAAVITGFLGLAWVPLNELRSVALGGILVVGVSVALATTLVPALLVFLGHRVGRGGISLISGRHGSGERWRRWALFVIAHPWPVVILGTLPLLALSVPALHMRTAVPAPRTLPDVEGVRGLEELQAMERLGATLALRIVLELPPGEHALSERGWEATRRLEGRLARDPRVGRVRSLPGVLPGELPPSLLRRALPDSIRHVFVGRRGRWAYLEAVPGRDVSPAEASALVKELRSQPWDTVTGVPGARVLVAGTPASNLDYEELLGRALPRVILLVLAATVVALFLGFRSVLIPLKAVALNLLSVGAAFGVLVLVFQDGVGAGWLGVTPSPEGVLPVIPVLVFCTVFGISMDYEVFLVARIREERRSGRDEVDAIAEGMARTAGLITGAAAIMVVVFGAFALGDFVSTQMLGLALGTAVLVDASVVRLAVGPAILALGGKWNWWPGGARD